MITPERTKPNVISTQEYILGNITKNRLFPANQLVSSGMEGSDKDRQHAIRSVIGGTGNYVGATGAVSQIGNGSNTTRIEVFNVNAPNYIFEFSLSLPELDLNGDQ